MNFVCFAATSGQNSSGDWSGHLEAALEAFHRTAYTAALDHYRAALEAAGPSPALRGRILRGIGACWFGLSDYQAALAKFLEARPYTLAGGNREDLVALDSNIGSVYLYQADLESAARIYRRALEEMGRAPPSRHRAAILGNLGVVELRRGRYRPAREYLRAAVRAAKATADLYTQAEAYDALGSLQLTVGKSSEAKGSFSEAKESFSAAKESFERGMEARRVLAGNFNPARSLYFLGLTELDLGRPQAAVEKLSESVRDAQQRDSLVDLWKAFYIRGRSYRVMGERERAVGDFQRAVEVLEAIRPNLVPQDPLLVRHEASHHEVYGALADLLLELGRTEEAFHAVELGRSQSLRALVGRQFPALELPAARQEALDAESLLLNFYLGEGGACLWAVTDSEARFYRLPPPSAWEADIRRFVDALEASGAEAGRLGRRLYRTLLEPVEPALLARRHWVIAAEGELVGLPFCALRGENSRYLIEQHSLSYIPSASVLASLERGAPREYEYDFLGVADPVANRADPRWQGAPAARAQTALPRLPASAAEVRTCARLFAPGQSAVLTGPEASKSELRRLAQHSYRYWHLTSHVVADREHPENSYLALSIPPGASGVEHLTVRDVLKLPAAAEMVLLNGCDSGTGKNLPGAGVIGLARAFLAAGARSVCATRWKIPDESGALVERLYRRMAPGGVARSVDRAEALRLAQLEMIRAGGWRSQPRYWAAYFLVGSRVTEPRGGSNGTEHAERP